MSWVIDLGDEVVVRGQTYRAVNYREHIKPDGSRVMLTELASPCATCGAEFVIAVADLRNHLNRRCAIHKRPGQWTRKRKG